MFPLLLVVPDPCGDPEQWRCGLGQESWAATQLEFTASSLVSLLILSEIAPRAIFTGLTKCFVGASTLDSRLDAGVTAAKEGLVFWVMSRGPQLEDSPPVGEIAISRGVVPASDTSPTTGRAEEGRGGRLGPEGRPGHG